MFNLKSFLIIPLAALAWAAPAAPARRQTLIPYPANDPFYTPPAGFENTAPGTILSTRVIEAGFLGLIPDPVEAYQLLYRTTAVNGSAIATVTTVFKPFAGHLDRFVSFTTAYDSATTESDPSYAYRLGSNGFNNLIPQLELLIIQGYLLQGYIVSSSDYEGPEAAFAAGHLEGYATLDSMRAVNNFASSLGLSTTQPAIAAHGYSGGAIATGWAASLHPTYAPELNVKGWAHGGTPANLTGTALLIDDTLFSGFLPAAIAGLSTPSAYGAQAQPLFNEIITPYGKQAVEYAQTHGVQDDIITYPFVSLQTYQLQTLGPAFFSEPTIKAIFDDNIMGATASETPKTPVLMYHALQDEIIPYLNASSLFHRYCDRGATVTFSTYEKGGHATTLVLGVPEVYQFVNTAFADGIAPGCVANSYDNSDLNLVGDLSELEPVLIGLINKLGQMNNNQFPTNKTI